MAPIPWLADVLRSAGLRVVEEGDWRSRGVSGSFNPIGVLWHHTAATSSPGNAAPALGTVINGRPDLQGPLCHALVDYNGVFHLISANRANHAGVCRGSGPIPSGDGNTMLIGWEIDYNGVNQSMTAAQYDASVRATAAVLQRLGRDASHARGHRETSTTGKIDPSFVNLDTMRADVAARMRQRAASPIAVGSDGTQMILNAGGTVMAKRGIGLYGWTVESDPVVKKIATNGGVQMILDRNGAVFAKDSIGLYGWTAESDPGIVDIAVGSDGTQMILNAGGTVMAKRGIGLYGWTVESDPVAVAIAAGSNGLQMILDRNGTVSAKDSIGLYGWTVETDPGVTNIATNGGVQMILDRNGVVSAKDGIGLYGWTTESDSIT